MGIWPELIAGAPATREELASTLRGLGHLDEAGIDRRVGRVWSRSLKASTQYDAHALAIRCVDLTTLEGSDTPARVARLVAKAAVPDPGEPAGPSCAAVCVYPDLVPAAVCAATNTGLRIASVATVFPSGRGVLALKLADVACAVAGGADEIDMVIDRGALLAGRYDVVLAEIRAVRAACADRVLKVILETGELGCADDWRAGAWLALAGGADFVKTSTGKVPVGATPASVLVLTEAVRDFAELTDRHAGVKAAGGIRSASDALRYLVLIDECAGADMCRPERFRLGASSLLDELVAQRRHAREGVYPSVSKHLPRG